MYLEFIPNATGDHRVEFAYEFDGEMVSEITAEAHAEKGDDPAVFPVPRIPVALRHPGTLTATLSIGGRKALAMSKQVKLIG